MRRIVVVGIFIAAISAVGAAGIVASFDAVSPRLVTRALESRLSSWTGTRVTVGRVTVRTLLPVPSVDLSDVVFSANDGGDAPSVTAPHASASLRLFPLLSGHIAFGSLTLVKPRLDLGGRPGTVPAEAVGRSAAGAMIHLALSALAQMELDRLSVQDGIAVYSPRQGGSHRSVTAIDLDLNWLPERGLALAGAVDWRDQRVSFDVQIDSLPSVLDSTGSRVGLALAAAPLAEAGAAESASPQRDAVVREMPGRSLRRLVRSLIAPVESGSAPRNVNLEGRLHVDPMSVTLSDLSVDPSNRTPIGWLSLRLSGARPSLSGSLAIERLPLGSSWTGLAPLGRLGANGSRSSLGQQWETDWLRMVDVDLQVSVGAIDLGSGTIKDFMTAISIRDGRLKIALQQAAVASGTAAGTLMVQAASRPSGDTSADLALHVTGFSVAAVAQLLQPLGIGRLLGTPPPLSGTGTVAATLSAHGNSAQAMMQSLGGRIALEVKDGRINGADVEASLTQLVDGSMTIANGYKPFLPVGGETPFSTVGVLLSADRGTMRAERAWLDGSGCMVRFSGTIDVLSADINGDGTAAMFDPTDDQDRATQLLIVLPFGVGGTLAAPNIVPGIPSFPGQTVRRSAVRDREVDLSISSSRSNSAGEIR